VFWVLTQSFPNFSFFLFRDSIPLIIAVMLEALVFKLSRIKTLILYNCPNDFA
jgi:hypothetical protein